MQRVIKIGPIIIGLFIAGILLVIFFGPIQNVLIRAENITPTNVTISNVAENVAKISWVTSRESQGVVEYGISPTDLNYYAPEVTRDTAHSVDLTLLAPNTTYYFQIRIGDKKFDNSGVPWTFGTKGAEEAANPVPKNQNAVLTPSPTPISSIDLSSSEAAPTVAACTETDCEKIKSKLGQGCNTVDYVKCLNKGTGSQ